VKSEATRLPGLIVIEPRLHRDERGFFSETFRSDRLAEFGITNDWVQDNQSRSRRGVLRGIHFQVGSGQAKLVRCARGEVLDVAVDLRRHSPTYGRWEAIPLDERSQRMVFVPIGFGHAFLVLSECADVIYKCSTYYDAELERAIAYDDPDIGIDWPVESPVVSERDRAAPTLATVADELPFAFAPQGART